MIAKPPRGLFVTGTDTGVGKTFVASAIAQQLAASGRRVGVYKPVASGAVWQEDQLIADDAVALWQAAGQPLTLAQVCPQVFAPPLAPHLAARATGAEVDERQLIDGLEAWKECDVVIVEGAGGLMSPVSEDLYVADLADTFRYPLVIVAPNQLGVINQTLQTLITASTYCEGLAIAGVVLNDTQPVSDEDPSRSSNLAELQQRCTPPVLAHVGWNDSSSIRSVSWWDLAAPG